VNQANSASVTMLAPVPVRSRSAHGTWPGSPGGRGRGRRVAASGQIVRVTNPTAAKNKCRQELPAPRVSGFSPTSTPARPPAIRMTRPGRAAGRTASPVITSQPPTTRNASVISQRSDEPCAASTLTVCLTGL
jgi:hypothetical protein